MLKSFFSRKYSKYLLFTLLFLVGILFYLQSTSPTTPSATPPPRAPHTTAASTATNKSVMPNGYIPNKTIRDPFAVPNTSAKRSGPATSQNSRFPIYGRMGLPVLTGIVNTDNYRVAILEYDGKSRYHRLQDKIGPYQLIAIGEKSVTLYSANGRQVLPLRR